MGIAVVGRDGRWRACSSRRPRRLLDFRIGRFDFGNMVQAVWSTAHGRPLEIDRRGDGRADEPPRRLTPIRSSRSSRRSGSSGPRRSCSRSRRSSSCRSGRCRSSGSGGDTSGSERAAALLALGYLAYPWVVTSAASAIHPVTFAVPFFLYCVWFLDTDRLVPFAAVRAARDVHGRADGAPDRRPRRLVRARAREAGRRSASIAARRSRGGRSSPSTSSSRRRRAEGSPTTASTTRSAARRTVSSRRCSPIRAWSSARCSGSRRRLPHLARPSRSACCSCSLPGSPPSACRSSSRTGCRTSRSMTDPRYHSVDAVVPFLIAATVFGIARIVAPRRRSRPRLCS